MLLKGTGILMFALTGCSLLESRITPLGVPVEKSAHSFSVTLGNRGRITVTDRLHVSQENCGKLKNKVKLSVQEAGGKRVKMSSPKCQGQWVSWVSRDAVPLGHYRIEFKISHPRLLQLRPKVVADFIRPEFNSSGDQLPEGAVKWEGPSVKGTVNAQAGDKTDWIQIEGAELTTLAFVPGVGSNIRADLFQVLGTHRRQIRELRSGESNRLAPQPGTYVRVQSERYGANTEYELVASTGPATRLVDVNVVELYQLNHKNAIVLFETEENIVAQQVIQVFGMRGSHRELLGPCQVESVESGQASCRMSAIPTEKFKSYEARAAVEG